MTASGVPAIDFSGFVYTDPITGQKYDVGSIINHYYFIIIIVLIIVVFSF